VLLELSIYVKKLSYSSFLKTSFGHFTLKELIPEENNDPKQLNTSDCPTSIKFILPEDIGSLITIGYSFLNNLSAQLLASYMYTLIL